MHTEPDLKNRVHLSIEALSPDVCWHRDFDRQCAPEEIEKLGSLDCEAMQASLPGPPNARLAITGMAGRQCHRLKRPAQFSSAQRTIQRAARRRLSHVPCPEFTQPQKCA